ncbi:MAG: DRTGG domain-containing protein [Chloroflexota bacterium]
MNLRSIITLVDGRVLTRQNDLELDFNVTSACGADLLSDVLAFVHAGALLLTGLTNPQVIRTAEVVELAAIIFVRGKEPARETIELAEAAGIPLILSPHTLFECSGRLYGLGVESCDVHGAARVAVNRRLQDYGRSGVLVH